MAKPQEPTRTQVANKVVEVAQAVGNAAPARRIDDIPKDFARADGASEIAVLTLTAMSHDFQFKPVMAALEKLAALKDWSHSFFVAHKTWDHRPTFDWREAPMRQYKSFNDFYERELERTFGNWESLQHTWSKVVKGEISEADAHDQIIEERRKKAALAEKRNLENPSRQGQRTDLFDDNFVSTDENVTHEVKRPTTGSVARALRKLHTDRPDLHQRVLNGELSANAAMIEAGFRKKRQRPKLTAKDRIRKLIEKLLPELSAEDCSELRRLFDP